MSGLFNSFYYGKAGKADFTPDQLPKNRVQLFFSMLRKVVLVTPLTLLLPGLGLGVDGVFWAEAISQVTGATACFLTMYLVIWKNMKENRSLAEK